MNAARYSRAPVTIAIGMLACLFALIPGCTYHAYRFSDKEPVLADNDTLPIPMPPADEFDRDYYYFNNLIRKPTILNIDLAGVPRSKDVNSFDDVPASSWHTPRLGQDDIDPAELLRGPEKVGPPLPPLTVLRTKSTGLNPKTLVRDSRGHEYLLLFDPPDFPCLQTTTGFIVNRLFWGFGYNVPEDHIFLFRKEDLNPGLDDNSSADELNAVLRAAASPVNGRYRALASLALEGTVLGPTGEKGTRRGDDNDHIDHKDRRVLRAMRVFGALTNHSNIRIDNMLDHYSGEHGSGYVRHYLLDFSEAFGGHGAKQEWLWNGYVHFFALDDFIRNIISLGLIIPGWENIAYTPWPSVGAFEAEIFHPEHWSELYQYRPIQRSRADDNYWAAKIVGSLTREHLAALIDAALYPEPEAARYMLATLIERRRKVLEYFLAQVSPIESEGLQDGKLALIDMGFVLLAEERVRDTSYEIGFFDDTGYRVAPLMKITGDSPEFEIPVSGMLLERAGGYLRIDLLVHRSGGPAPSPAQFHIRRDGKQPPRLVGIVH